MSELSKDLIRRPEEALYRTIYAPVDLHELLASAESRSRIRRLPPVQLFFGLKELTDEEVAQLAPHVTQEQWQAVIDLDIWSRDNANVHHLINLQRHILLTDDPVARKLIGAADPDLWELALSRLLKIHPKVDEEYEGEPEEGDYLETPDQQYLLVLPRNPELARVMRAILLRAYEVDPAWIRLRLEAARFRTRTELTESAYEKRTKRVEEMGFQDYYEAVEIYASLVEGEKLPLKKSTAQLSTLPASVRLPESEALLLMQLLAQLSRSQDISLLLEELFFVCNKILTADRVSPGEPKLVRRGIRKALTGINLGLDLWSEGKPERALAGVQEVYLQSFFRLGCTRLAKLRVKADRITGDQSPETAAFIRGLRRKYPVQSWLPEPGARLHWRFFSTSKEVEKAQKRLEAIQ
ncbi:MAG: hypothetical protein EHM61_15815 [Acidobacteria bacterium]|nr:MAG: hypothetical protein EHM61_15815 [Acidobacteriota bacterium]